MLESQEMRKVYCDTMIALAKEDPRIVDVEADLTGAHGMKPFKAAYPDRSFNVGIAEANMVGVAAGLSACGKIPFVHSFATFASRRCFDQIAISMLRRAERQNRRLRSGRRRGTQRRYAHGA